MKTIKTINSQVVKGYLLGAWWYNWGLVKNVTEGIKCYIADCPAYIKGNNIFVEIAPERVLCEKFTHIPTIEDIEGMTAKINHLKSINYERFKS